MTRGRRPAPEAVQAAKGNTRRQRGTGKAAQAKAAQAAAAAEAAATEAKPEKVGRMPGYMTLRKRKLSVIGERTRIKTEQIMAFMQPRAEAINFLKDTDVNGFARFCRYMAEWLVSLEVIDEEGFFYETSSPHTENMKRVHPAVLMRKINEQNLRMLEAEFGFTPARRQQMMLQMANAGIGIPASAQEQQQVNEVPPPAFSPLGFLGGGAQTVQ